MFKVGDRVRASRNGSPRYGNPVLVQPRDEFIDREGTVMHVHNADPAEDGYWGVQFENGYDAISGVYLKLVESATPQAAATPATPPQAADAPTLRDQFAMAAMHSVRVSELNYAAPFLAAGCYAMADAMLAARDRKAGAQ